MIKRILGREVLDSRGNPTVEVELTTNSCKTRAIVPSGKSTGKFEAVELRDGGKRYFGQGVQKAVKNVNLLGKKLIGKKLSDVDEILLKLDGTENKSRYGANAILGISIAAAKAKASSLGISRSRYFGRISGNSKLKLPSPMFNVINGG